LLRLYDISSCRDVMQRRDLASMQGACSGEYSHPETAREYARFSTESTIFRPGRDDLQGGLRLVSLRQLRLALHKTTTLKSPRLATFPQLVHTQSRLILLSRINGDAPRA